MYVCSLPILLRQGVVQWRWRTGEGRCELTLGQQLGAHGTKLVAQLHEQVVNGTRQLIGRGVGSLQITIVVVVVVDVVIVRRLFSVGGQAVELADELVGVSLLVLVMLVVVGGGAVGGGGVGGVGGCAGWYWDGHCWFKSGRRRGQLR